MSISRTKFTVPHLAKLWGVDPAKIRWLVKTGRLRAIDVGAGAKRPRLLIDVTDIAAFEKASEVVPASPPPRSRRNRRAAVEQFI